MSGALAPAWGLVCIGLWLAGWLPGWHPAWDLWFWTPGPVEAGPLLAALGRHFIEALAAAAVALTGLAAGPSVLALTAPRRRDPPAALVLTAGLVVVLPAAVLGLGLAGLLRPPALTTLALVGAVAGLRILRRTRPFTGVSPAGAIAVIALCLPALVVALAPETSYDALQYHLALPARFLARAKVFDAGLEPLSNFHLGGEMLFAFGQAVGGDGAARLLAFGGLPLAIALLAGATRAAGLTGPLAAAPWLGFAASPLAIEIAGHAYTDLPAIAAFAALGAVVAGGRGGWILVGLLAGAAGAVKLSATLLGFGMLAVLVPRGHRMATALAWLIPQLPWIAKNLALAGSPFGGLVLGSVFPALAQGEETRPFLSHMQWVPFGHPSLWLWLPRFLLRDAGAAGGEYSPLLVMLLPALFVSRGALRPAAARLAPAALAALALWVVAGGGQARWLAPVLPLAALAAVLRLGRRPPGRASAIPGLARGWAVAFSLVAALAWMRACAMQFITASPLRAALGVETPRAYLASRVTPRGWYMAIGAFLEERPALGRPYLAGDIKAYYWPRDPLVDSQHRNPWLVRWCRDGERIAVGCRQRRLGCLVHRMEGSLTMQQIMGGYAWNDRSLAALERFVVRDLDPVWTVDRPAENTYYLVYAIRPPVTPASAANLHWLQLPYAELVYDDADKALVAGRLDEAARGFRALLVRFPRFAVPRLRLAEIDRLRRDAAGQARWEGEAARLLGIPAR
ncbi:MAG: hypothetical protein AAB152_12985 [Candidatus Coatesbacteria bacterium]